MKQVEQITSKVTAYIAELLGDKHPNFTGSLALNFKDGKLKDIVESRRTKCEEGN